MNETYDIILNDGTIFSNCLTNGSYFLTDENINDDTFIGKLTTVTIITKYKGDKINEITKSHGILADIRDLPDLEGTFHHGFTLNFLSQDEIKLKECMSNIEYLAMMADIDLDD